MGLWKLTKALAVKLKVNYDDVTMWNYNSADTIAKEELPISTGLPSLIKYVLVSGRQYMVHVSKVCDHVSLNLIARESESL